MWNVICIFNEEEKNGSLFPFSGNHVVPLRKWTGGYMYLSDLFSPYFLSMFHIYLLVFSYVLSGLMIISSDLSFSDASATFLSCIKSTSLNATLCCYMLLYTTTSSSITTTICCRCFEKISENGGVTRAQYETMFAKYLGSQESFCLNL